MRFKHEVAFSKGFCALPSTALTKYKDEQREAEQNRSGAALEAPISNPVRCFIEKDQLFTDQSADKKSGSCFLLQFSFLDIFLRGIFRERGWFFFTMALMEARRVDEIT